MRFIAFSKDIYKIRLNVSSIIILIIIKIHPSGQFKFVKVLLGIIRYNKIDRQSFPFSTHIIPIYIVSKCDVFIVKILKN